MVTAGRIRHHATGTASIAIVRNALANIVIRDRRRKTGAITKEWNC
jgi:hypothetical protein